MKVVVVVVVVGSTRHGTVSSYSRRAIRVVFCAWQGKGSLGVGAVSLLCSGERLTLVVV